MTSSSGGQVQGPQMTRPAPPLRWVDRAGSYGAQRLAWFSRLGWMSPLAVLLVVVPSVVMMAPLVAHHGPYSNWGDGAATELSVQNAARLHQTVGPYDRFGWDHPGPMYFYLLAIPYVLMDWNGAGLPVGSALIVLASAVGIVVVVARRIGGTAALATAALLCAFESVMGVPNVTNIWGPIVVTMPAAFFLVLAADFAAGNVWSLVGATVVGTFLVQTDISTVSVVISALILAVAVRLVAWRKAGTLSDNLHQSRPVWAATVLVAAVLWALPVWQQLVGQRGNLEHLVGFFIRHLGHHGAHEALSAAANGMLNRHVGLGDQIGFSHRYDVYLALFLLAVGGLAVVCWRRRQGLALALATETIAVTAVVGVSLVRVWGPLFGYLVWWSRALTLCAAIAAVLCIAGLVGPARLPQGWNRPARLAGSTLVLGVAVFASWHLSDSASRFHPDGGYANVTAASTAVERLLPLNAHHLLVCVTTDAAWPTSAGVVADLSKDGLDPRVNQSWLYVFGGQLTPSGHETVVVFLADLRQRSLVHAVSQARTTSGGDLAIGVFSPPHGYVSSAECPPVHNQG